MNPCSLQATPRWPSIVRAQLRVVGGSIRREMAVSGLLLAAVTVLFLVDGGERFEFDLSELAIFAAMLGFVAPMAVWKGEEPSRRSYFWALPVDRARHTLVKVFSGWAWLMALAAVLLLWALAFALLSGGNVGIGADRAHVLLGGFPEGARVLEMSFHGHPWMWLVPFTAATISYLLGSSVVLSSDHPWRWYAGFAFTLYLLLDVAEVGWMGWLLGGLGSRYGIEAAFMGTSDQSIDPVNAAGPVGVVDLPDFSAWAVATLLWTALALAGVVASAYRQQER